ncbi:DUF2306 domain-containing protein [Stieleria varia]|uniref:Membrane protein (DUF2306) n=1 Tax=Stieleria varia TaxID=2528005 RepID=A0A5C6A1W9_9BACT|nr:DUF2306 domain-containing protein [Stieleria varia]TWT93231.1 hypothetical protein Pla52n_58880 [Stieleria varia]
MMREFIGQPTPWRLLKWWALAMAFWIGWRILTPFPHYLPPDFGFGFLRNKSEYFYRSGYFVGFYLHIFAAPTALFIGGFQMSGTIRRRWPRLHRHAGQVYVAIVLLAAAPGGLVMATKSFGGWSTTICFSAIALTTWLATFLGWRAAIRFDFRAHALWMIRSYVLMMSAVFLRLGHFALLRTGWSLELTYQIAAWASWLLPMLVLEILVRQPFQADTPSRRSAWKG